MLAKKLGVQTCLSRRSKWALLDSVFSQSPFSHLSLQSFFIKAECSKLFVSDRVFEGLGWVCLPVSVESWCCALGPIDLVHSVPVSWAGVHGSDGILSLSAEAMHQVSQNPNKANNSSNPTKLINLKDEEARTISKLNVLAGLVNTKN